MKIACRTSLATVFFASWVIPIWAIPTWARAAEVDFERQVLPVLKRKCIRCHGSKKVEGGLRLDIRQRALVGGDSGRAIRPGKPSDSLLIKRVAAADPAERMPPEGQPVSQVELRILRKWVAAGAPWPDKFAGTATTTKHLVLPGE